MSDPTDSGRIRELGIEFGALARQLERHEYPATGAELVATYGDAVLQFQNGEQTLAEVLQPVSEERFDSAADARTAIFSNVTEDAIGRKGYSDRTPPALGERTDTPTESF
ncbi:DUF5789 family protein [Natronolimnohabitans innermongolicus]|uniref:DUF2795 domain-containing protein n=1 Tax=Natronolimnohabitans innermongolicus JCM 12255 TaxID=1227499 RepID=L9XI68_9EURY|nr:hypothetical protein [Natronolimnohabitans innermongolicus]ELY61091.1 hypothetical protein C493_03195 [Natronolimnohabitans innermongolicus JCM 12255]